MRLFSEAERAWCGARRFPWVHYAARFAAKEAVRKALGRPCPWSAIEVRRLAGGAPYLALASLLTSDGCRITGSSLSLTHDGGVAIAVVALGGNARTHAFCARMGEGPEAAGSEMPMESAEYK